MKIVDYKPKNSSILDQKPVNQAVFEAKPKNDSIDGGLTDQLYDSTITKGMPMLLLAITYPNTFTFQTTFHP